MTIFYINKENLNNNLKIIKSQMLPQTKICAMVKADAYSHSSNVICKLICGDVDYFGVASVREGIEIRKQKINTPILCVGAFSREDIFLASKHNIDLTIHSKYYLKILKNIKIPLNIHIKIDTGMSRLGIKSMNDFKEILKFLKTKANIKIKGIFSHFSDSLNKEITANQVAKFNKFSKQIEQKNILKHISNSGGILNTNLNFDMCRVGMALYGYGALKGLKPVLEIKSKIVDIHDLKTGESVGYEQKFITKKKTQIATIPFGYADGLDTRYSGASILIAGKMFKIVGKICMDMFMCEIDRSVQIGDEVTILFNAEYLAKYANKSVYEVLSNFKNKRCKILVK